MCLNYVRLVIYTWCRKMKKPKIVPTKNAIRFDMSKWIRMQFRWPSFLWKLLFSDPQVAIVKSKSTVCRQRRVKDE